MACGLLAARDFRERPRVGYDGFGDGLAIDELPFAAAGDQPGFAQNLEMMRALPFPPERTPILPQGMVETCNQLLR